MVAQFVHDSEMVRSRDRDQRPGQVRRRPKRMQVPAVRDQGRQFGRPVGDRQRLRHHRQAHRRQGFDLGVRQLQFLVQVRVADRTEFEDTGNRQPGPYQGMAQAHRRQVPARRPAGQHDGAVDTVRRTVRGQPVERCVDLRHDLGQRCVGRQRIARQHRRPAARMRSGDEIAELFLRVALPVAAVDVEDAGCVRVGDGENVHRVALARSVAQIKVQGIRHSERGGCDFPSRVEHGAVGDVVSVVVGGITLRLRKHAPFSQETHAAVLSCQCPLHRSGRDDAGTQLRRQPGLTSRSAVRFRSVPTRRG